jgi:hypothetical protein
MSHSAELPYYPDDRVADLILPTYPITLPTRVPMSQSADLPYRAHPALGDAARAHVPVCRPTLLPATHAERRNPPCPSLPTYPTHAGPRPATPRRALPAVAPGRPSRLSPDHSPDPTRAEARR